MNRLEGRIALVTGAARGIGRACTEAFLDEGATVVAADRAWEGVEEYRDRLERSAAVVVTTVDITKPAEVASVGALVRERLGALDVVLNNAGMRQRELYPPAGAVTVLDSSNGDWEAMFSVNVLGTLNVTRELAPLLVARGGGSIINVGSGDNPTYRNQPYAASKAALASMSRYLAEELREHNVAVNVLRPSGTMTTGSAETADALRAIGIATARLLRPEHVVPLAVHLATQDASGDTGQVLAAARWNEEHGFGPADEWVAAPT
ncbi:MAG: SDR family oxidoreductase [Acidimicrobiales bacterium]|nr:SDR family oxidoreductase [Acidimicrobiales bacterium]MBO0893950.1 SDR family oxidoreductase [Acidimicrobiales bacterium]